MGAVRALVSLSKSVGDSSIVKPCSLSADVDRLEVQCRDVDQCRQVLLCADWTDGVFWEPRDVGCLLWEVSTAVVPPTAAETSTSSGRSRWG